MSQAENVMQVINIKVQLKMLYIKQSVLLKESQTFWGEYGGAGIPWWSARRLFCSCILNNAAHIAFHKRRQRERPVADEVMVLWAYSIQVSCELQVKWLDEVTQRRAVSSSWLVHSAH